MAVPSRKNRMMQTIIKNQEIAKEKLKGEVKSKEVTSEEHEKRVKMLKEMGLLKKD